MEINYYHMKRMINALLLISTVLMMSACELDNYEGPNAKIFGSVLDATSGEPIEQDIVDGSKILYIEHGYQNPETQNMVIKTDGSYRNNLMFAGTYTIFFNESNFVRPDTLKDYTVRGGDNTLDFEVQPYIRVSDESISRVGDKIVASFTITPTVGNEVKEVGLFAHVDYVVGNRFKLVEKKQAVNAVVGSPTTYVLEIDLTTGDGSKLKSGHEYYFRVGALINAPGAKYNYASAKLLGI